MKPLVSIIIVHWNTPDLLKKQLMKLVKNKSLQIIVVDNHSSKSMAWLKYTFPSIEFIGNKKNKGYASACNQGAKRGKGEWLLFINPDVEINPEQIITMINFLKKDRLDAASPLPDSVAYRKPLPTPFSLLVEFTPLNKFISLNNFKNKTLFGGCLLIRTNIFQQLNGWDDDFFLWFEDSDLTYRLLQKKYSIGWIPIKIKHIGGASFAKLDDKLKRKLFFTSMSIFANKHFSFVGRFIVWLIKTRYLFD